jgi:glycosyltransferase involved in cell wall biosynthesis
VASSFNDPRIVYIRNSENLGNLQNYNKGISLARGEFIWLISADDFLLKPYVLDHYVRMMDANPTVGYAFCPGIGMVDGKFTTIIGAYGQKNRIIPGHQMFRRLLEGNFVLAASGIVRRTCYEQISLFPLAADWRGLAIDMKWLGDWYLWCVFALVHDVGYFAEPMVCYREHDLSMSNIITKPEVVQSCADSDIGFLWMMKHRVESGGLKELSEPCFRAILSEYYRQGVGKYFRASTYTISLEHLESSLQHCTPHTSERTHIKSYVLEAKADSEQRGGEKQRAQQFYKASLREQHRLKVHVKLVLSSCGAFGDSLRKIVGIVSRYTTSALFEE